MFKLSLKNLNLVFLGLSIFVARSLTSDKLLSYYLLVVFITLGIIFLLLKPNILKYPCNSFSDYLPAISILTWLYGLLLGFSRGYSVEAVISNFAGMVFYIFYYFLFAARHKSINLIGWMILLSCCYLLYFSIPLITELNSININNFMEIGLVSLRLGWSSSLSVAILLIGIGFSKLIKLSQIKEKNIYDASIFQKLVHPSNEMAIGYVLLGITSVALTGSKGFTLASIFLLFLLFSIKIIRSLIQLRTTAAILIILFFCFLFIFSYYDNIISILDLIIELETHSEHPRSVQKLELISDFTFWGHGLGAGLSQGYSRDDLGYGFELTFHNIIHKFGIFSLLAFATIFTPIVVAFLNLIRGYDLIKSLSAFSLMLYVIPGYGNPILYSPFNVLLNCVALYLISNRGR